MKQCHRLILAAAVALLGASGASAPAGAAGDVFPLSPATMTARESTSLADINPAAALPAAAPVPGQAPVEALELFAKARLAIEDNDRAEAISLLEHAASIDPDSFEVSSLLGRAYAASGAEFDDRSIASLERSAQIEPDHLWVQTELGRQLLHKGDVDAAIARLRLALLTHEYRSDFMETCRAEYYLADALRRAGYLTAAVEIYDRLSDRLHADHPPIPPRSDVGQLAGSLDVLDNVIADLLTEAKQYPRAIALRAKLVEEHPTDIECRGRHVALLLKAKKYEDAIAAAEAAAVQFHGARASIGLLHQVYTAMSKPDDALVSLRRLHTQHGADIGLFKALIDEMRQQKMVVDAAKLLSDAAAARPGDYDILRLRVDLDLSLFKRADAARLIIEASASRPDLAMMAWPLWQMLTRPSPQGRITAQDLIALDVPPGSDGARWYWVSQAARTSHREGVSQRAIEKAIAANPPFVQAVRDQFDMLPARVDLTPAQRQAAADDLIASATARGDLALAEELRGRALQQQNKPAEAAAALKHAVELGGHSLEVQYALSLAQRAAGSVTAADAVLWKIISDEPDFDLAYRDLFMSALKRHSQNQAEHVLTLWENANPTSPEPRRLAAILLLQEGHLEPAVTLLFRVVRDHPDDGDSLEALRLTLSRRGENDAMLQVLRDLHVRAPDSLAVSRLLVRMLIASHRSEEAGKVADDAAKQAANDATALYDVAGFYALLGSMQQSQDTLQLAVKADPTFAAPANDLGFTWAEAGVHLDEASRLIKFAVKEEPNNASYLDSMGWVLYKRGRWAQARQNLDRAITLSEAAGDANPVLYDHRGDVLYRLGDQRGADADWKKVVAGAAALGDGADEEIKSAARNAAEKSRQLKLGRAVPVSPVDSSGETR